MNIITNNCLGGFIYRDILKTEYQNPFIWTYLTTNEFLFLCEHFDKINFNNFMIDKEGEGNKNNYVIKIDEKITLAFHHIWFDKECNEPIIKNSFHGIDVHYNKPWKYIVEKYEKRLSRMVNTPRFYFYFDTGIEDISNLQHLIEICERQHIYGVIISHRIKFAESKYVLQIESNKDWLNPENGGWGKPIVKCLGHVIENFLKERTNNEICCNNV